MSGQRARGAIGTAPSGAAIPSQRPGMPGAGRRRGSSVIGAAGLAAAGNRGLPASGAIALALGVGVGGGAVDVLTGAGLRTVFAVAFVLGCMLAAALVRRQSLLAAVVAPPLAYVALALAAAAVQPDSSSTSWLMRQVFELLTALVTGAPVLITATIAAAAVALFRLTVRRSPPVPHMPPG